MADNTDLNAGSGGDTIATDDIGGVKFQRVKLIHGADGTNDGDVSSANPLPVGGTVDLGATDNAVLDAIVAALGGTIVVDATGQGDIPITLAGEEPSVNLQDGAGNDINSTSNALHVRLASQAADVTIADGGNSITIDGTVDLGATDNAVLDSIVTALGGVIDVDATGQGDVPITLDSEVVATTLPGLTPYRNLDVDETEDQVSASAVNIGWLHVMNTTNEPLFLKLFNATAASVTVGTTTPTNTFMIPTQGDANGAGVTIAIPDGGLIYSTALTIACTTALADADTGAPGANACIVNLGYR